MLEEKRNFLIGLNLVFALLVLLSAALVYRVKYDAEQMETHLVFLQNKIQTTQDAVALLRAEWSVLTQPDRLQSLVDQYHAELELRVPFPEQIVPLYAVFQSENFGGFLKVLERSEFKTLARPLEEISPSFSDQPKLYP